MLFNRTPKTQNTQASQSVRADGYDNEQAKHVTRFQAAVEKEINREYEQGIINKAEMKAYYGSLAAALEWGRKTNAPVCVTTLRQKYEDYKASGFEIAYTSR